MRKVNAYVNENLSDKVKVLIDDYPNEDGLEELAININLDSSVINLYKINKKDGSVEYLILDVDKNTKVLTRYKAEEVGKIEASEPVLTVLNTLFKTVENEVNVTK